ncbi:MAG: hypothetical protein E6Q97_12355 [Desulfurellales bacterium]|nr:MAG: hypothetical protein E6Q97_12355 [Desulfurellales bacterium]
MQLTEEQKRKISAVHGQYVDMLLDSETRLDREAALAAIHGMCEAIEFAAPEQVIFVDSPVEGAAIHAQLMHELGSVKEDRDPLLQIRKNISLSLWTNIVKRGLDIESAWNDRTQRNVRNVTTMQIDAQWALMIEDIREPMDAKRAEAWRAALIERIERKYGITITVDLTDESVHELAFWKIINGPELAASALWSESVHLLGIEPETALDKRVFDATIRLFHDCNTWWTIVGDTLIISERPNRNEINTEPRENQRGTQERFVWHAEDGPAHGWPDGEGAFYVMGVRVPRQVVMEPETLDPQQIIRHENQEVRRVMIDRYGAQNLFERLTSKVIHEDETGRLRRIEVPGDDEEPIVVVEVLNSTPEPDGTIKTYYLRVPPTTRRAKEGVAWTFGVDEAHYELEFQS